ncbi:MAG: hypothetical protein AAGG75_13620 [Bacteroidota bacterium]
MRRCLIPLRYKYGGVWHSHPFGAFGTLVDDGRLTVDGDSSGA